MTAAVAPSAPRIAAAGSPGLAHGRTLGTAMGCARANAGRPNPAEAAELAATLGRVLREARAAAGLSATSLARGMGAAGTTITRLERGLRRPRAALLADVAAVLTPRNPGPLTAKLATAAGPSLMPDTPTSLHQRARCRRKAQRERQALWQCMAKARADGFDLMRAFATASLDLDTEEGLAGVERYLARRAQLERSERYYRHAAQRWPRPPLRRPEDWR